MNCPCGRPLHYSSSLLESVMTRLVERHGENIPVTVGDRTWLVSRHYIALHGLVATDLPSLGFHEVSK